MPTWASDYSDSWKFVDGVVDAQVYPPASTTPTTCKARKDELTGKDLSGGAFGVSPTDAAFFVWLAVPQAEGRLVIGSDQYTVLSVTTRPDDAYSRAIVRKRV